MRIKRCVVSRPGLFNNRTLDFNEGLTVVYGRNGSGKSLLARAILELLWGSAHPLSLLKKGSWESLYMELNLSTSFEYTFVRNGDRALSILGGNGKSQTEIFRGDPAMPHDSVRAALIDHLASRMDDPVLRTMYAAMDANSLGTTSFIPSPTDDLEAAPLEWDTVRFMLLQDPSGLYGLYRSTFGGTGRSAAPFLDELLRAESNLKEIEKRTRIIDIQQSRGDKIQKERRQVENEIARIDNRIAALRVEKALAEKLLLMTGKLRTIEERIADITNELRESDELIANIAAHGASIESRFPQFRDFTDQKKQNLKRLQETYREIRDIHVAQDNYFSARRTRFQKATGIIAITGSGGVALLYFLVNRGLLALPPRMRIYLLGGIAALLAIMTAVLYLPLFIPRKPRELVALQEARAEIEARLREILSENEIELHDYKLESVYGFLLQYFEEYGEYADGLLDLFRLREGLKSPEYLSSLQEERHELAAAAGARREEILAELPRLARYGSREIDETRLGSAREDIEMEILRSEEERRAEMKILAQLEEEARTTANYDEELRLLGEERSSAEERYGGLAARRRAMELIASVFEEVIVRREASQVARLAREARDRFNAITENRHITEIDEDTLARFIKGGGRLDGLNPTTAHLLLLAVKITMSDFILESGGIPPPLIVDDPFIFMDDRRGENLERLLFEAAAKRQIIVFTQHRSHADRNTRIEL